MAEILGLVSPAEKEIVTGNGMVPVGLDQAGRERVAWYGPIHRSGKYTLQFSGRLYSRRKLCESLGIVDAEACKEDASLLLTAYGRHGTAAFEKLEGVFAFALFDPMQAKLFLVRNHVGTKPLYYYRRNGRLLFADALKHFSRFDFFEKRLDISALACYFTYGFILQPNAIFEGCYKVEAGSWLEVDMATGDTTTHRYWDPGLLYEKNKFPVEEAETLRHTHALLRSAVQKRLDGVKNPALLLSGGYDSATIAAIIRESGAKLRTYTVGFEESAIDESPYAEAVANYLDTDHTTYRLTDADAMRVVPALSETYEEPFFDDGAIGTVAISRHIAREGGGELFCGDGGDEVFATADDIERFRRITALPFPLRQTVSEILGRIDLRYVPWLRDRYNLPTKYEKFIRFIGAQDIPQMVQARMTLFPEGELRELLQHKEIDFRSRFDAMHFGRYAQITDRITGSYFQTFLYDGELVKTTQAAAYAGLAVREPYLDRELVGWMARVDERLKLKGGVKKYLLKEIAHSYIPRKLLERPKQGFSIPSSSWMRGPLREMVTDTLSERSLKADGVLNPATVIKLRDDFFRGREIYKYKLWSIFLYQLWYQHAMHQRSL